MTQRAEESSPLVPRLAPRRPLPPYAFIGDGFGLPHPRRDPGGHMHGNVEHDEPAPLDPASWRESEAYLFGLDLFNHGYYWESHEEWEGLWIAAAKKGPVSEFVKGLIKLAAAAVKIRQGQLEGTRRHGARAEQHFELAREMVGGAEHFAGLAFAELIEFAREVQDESREWPSFPASEVGVVYERRLWPEEAP